MNKHLAIPKKCFFVLCLTFLLAGCGGVSSLGGGADNTNEQSNNTGNGGSGSGSDDDNDSEVQWEAGGYVDKNVTGGGLTSARLRIVVRENGELTASFQGVRDGEGFSIPLSGAFSDNNIKFRAFGKKGSNDARISGNFTNPSNGPKQLVGKIQGTVNGKNLSTTFKALKN